MRYQLTFLSIALLAILPAACANPEVSAQSESGDNAVRAIVTYRERIALPANAVIELRLMEVSAEGAAVIPIADAVIPADGRQVPISAELRYDPGMIDPDRGYAIRGTILSDGRIMFATSKRHSVITGGNPTQLELSVDRIPSRPATATPENIHWWLLGISDDPSLPAAAGSRPHLRMIATNDLSEGDTGCNLFSGPYSLKGDSLRFGELTSTTRACSDPRLNRRELLLLAALNETRNWSVVGDTLVLAGPAGEVARFVAASTR